jgi:hypothetical protein
MFGMLDYRAHKLFWLLTLPFRLALRVFYFIFIAIAISLGELGDKEITKLVKPYMPSWFQTAIVHPQFFNSIMAATIIIMAIMYLSPGHSG